MRRTSSVRGTCHADQPGLNLRRFFGHERDGCQRPDERHVWQNNPRRRLQQHS
jgi:hypothetical protein